MGGDRSSSPRGDHNARAIIYFSWVVSQTSLDLQKIIKSSPGQERGPSAGCPTTMAFPLFGLRFKEHPAFRGGNGTQGSLWPSVAELEGTGFCVAKLFFRHPRRSGTMTRSRRTRWGRGPSAGYAHF